MRHFVFQAVPPYLEARSFDCVDEFGEDPTSPSIWGGWRTKVEDGVFFWILFAE